MDKPFPRFAIRAAGRDDAADVATLMTALGYPSTAELVSSRLQAMRQNPDHTAFVAIVDDRAVGLISACVLPVYHRDTPAGWITSLVVDDTARGAGIGAALVAEAEAWLAARGAETVTVTSNVQRDGAHAFYRRLGYEHTGLRFARPLSDLESG